VSAQPKTSTFLPLMTMSTNMIHVARFADVLPVAAIVSRLSAKSLRRMEHACRAVSPVFRDTVTTIDLESRSRRHGCFTLLLRGLLSGLTLEQVGCDR
jgi:hypothetical protein